MAWLMRLIIISTTLLLGLAFAQRGADLNTGTKVYFLNDDSHKQWCGYASESRLKTQIQNPEGHDCGRSGLQEWPGARNSYYGSG